MSNVYAFHLMSFTRQKMLKQLESLPESKRNVVPAAFNNSIHWQLGHVVTIAERIVYGIAGKKTSLPETYNAFFGPSTKPADWSEEPPSWGELMQLFHEQPSRFSTVFTEILDEPVAVKDNFAQAETIGDLLFLNNVHESNHLGLIIAMVKVLNNQ